MGLLLVRSAAATLALFALAANAIAVSPTAEGFRKWIGEFREAALASGIKPEIYDALTKDITPDFTLPDLDIPVKKPPEQAEFTKTPEQYLSEKYIANLAERARALIEKHKAALAKIEKTYGIDPALLLALWGRETAFGGYKLPYNALQVLATEAYIGRRPELFRKQFLLALRMVQDRVISPKDMRSSWAGAMGLVQFLPSDYYNYAVDEDGDGKRDIWNSVPDALASLANNLKSIGWDGAQPWGFEVRLPEGVSCSLANLDVKKPVSEWVGMGIRPMGSDAFPKASQDWQASLLLPAGTHGPAFLTFDNFQVIREYNKADLYALFVGHLADRIKGGRPFSKKWEAVTQIPSTDVAEIQKRLTALKLYNDSIDGKAGGRTRSALGVYQKQAGLPETCWPTSEALARLRRDPSAKLAENP